MKKPIIIHRDEIRINQFTDALERALPLLQQAWDAFKETGFYDPGTDLAFLVQNHSNLKHAYKLQLVRDMHPVPEGSVLQLDAEEEVKKWKVPTPAMDQAVLEIQNHFNQNGINAGYFSIEGDKVVVNEQTFCKREITMYSFSQLTMYSF